jgi:hypothetical protein
MDSTMTITMIRKSIALNNAGIYCMESNNAIAAINMFTAARKTHEELNKEKLLIAAKRNNSICGRRNERRRKINSFTATRSLGSSTSSMIENNDAVLMTDQQQLLQNIVQSVSASSFFSIIRQQQQRTRMTTRIINVDEFFIRLLPEQHETGSWIVFRGMILLPPIEELPMSFPFASREGEEHGENDNCQHSREEEEIIMLSDEEGQEQEQESSNFIEFLSTSYAFNLASAHHQRGCELSLLGTSDDIHEHRDEATALSRISLRQYHLNCAGQLYEITLKLERKRSDNEVKLSQEREREHCNPNSSSSSNQSKSNSNWFTPRIILACINNLAHMHYLLNNTIQSQRCYRQLRSTVGNTYLRSQQANSINRDDREREKDYLQFFWTSAYRGLLQHHYLTSNSSPSTSSSTAISPSSPTNDQSIPMVATNNTSNRRTNDDISDSNSSIRNSAVASSSNEQAAAA